jgi:hypothetical protein
VRGIIRDTFYPGFSNKEEGSGGRQYKNRYDDNIRDYPVVFIVFKH